MKINKTLNTFLKTNWKTLISFRSKNEIKEFIKDSGFKLNNEEFKNLVEKFNNKLNSKNILNFDDLKLISGGSGRGRGGKSLSCKRKSCEASPSVLKNRDLVTSTETLPQISLQTRRFVNCRSNSSIPNLSAAYRDATRSYGSHISEKKASLKPSNKNRSAFQLSLANPSSRQYYPNSHSTAGSFTPVTKVIIRENQVLFVNSSNPSEVIKVAHINTDPNNLPGMKPPLVAKIPEGYSSKR